MSVCCPLAASHTFTSFGLPKFQLVDASHLPSALNATEEIPSALVSNVSNHTPLVASHTFTDLSTRLADTSDLLSAIMRPEGLARMTAYLAENPNLDTGQRRRVTSVFLDKFALPEVIEQDIDMPGWDDRLVAGLSANYDRDVTRIMQIPGVTVLTP